MYEIIFKEGQQYIVDLSHLVLWENDMEFSTELSDKGLATSFLSGDGI